MRTRSTMTPARRAMKRGSHPTRRAARASIRERASGSRTRWPDMRPRSERRSRSSSCNSSYRHRTCAIRMRRVSSSIPVRTSTSSATRRRPGRTSPSARTCGNPIRRSLPARSASAHPAPHTQRDRPRRAPPTASSCASSPLSDSHCTRHTRTPPEQPRGGSPIYPAVTASGRRGVPPKPDASNPRVVHGHRQAG